MRIVLHDGSGHAFTVQLARELAHRGHAVLYVHFAGFQGPKGPLRRRAGDSPNLEIAGLDLDAPYAKYSLLKRRQQEIAYGKMAAARTLQFEPDVVIAANLSLEQLRVLQARCLARGVRFITWVQDIYSAAIKRLLSKRMPGLGNAVGSYYQRMERNILARSNGLVLISDDFRDVFEAWGVQHVESTTVENWSPIEDAGPVDRDNCWARECGLVDKRVILYSGTMGLKHDPSLISEACVQLRAYEDVAVVVVSEGLGADWLQAQKAELGLENLLILPFQPHDRFSEVLGAATVQFGMLDPTAGVYSVPSKVLSYLKSGRAIVLAVPSENLAARVVQRAGAGLTVPPSDRAGVMAALQRLIQDPPEAARMGLNARRYAEEAFDIGRIADRFEEVLCGKEIHAGRMEDELAYSVSG